ncbi:carboxymuconolactone decarboxylase family protein [Streptacidiphilus jiangxiensis]|uniref:Alkylhydroperoxidase AhpD family core domain-containing protein n=1 Tax=Streptacidiphilus jiangxiensis TaxID=235985 RepID=A0A1H7MW09_STRJI|nr:carboxymuconolactone decarboxylase family protein [Streptacidiphilus jiangxiensis]SEL14875.1 alkylhydroperoxidase AhpD family core domain-containing protein [Streptacidiphilus jiangxiensis]
MRPFVDKVAPEVWEAATAYSAVVTQSATARGLSAQERELIKVRASQVNGCAFCLDLHAREARQAGVPQQKLDLLPAWRETDVYSDREKAVLAIAEAATKLPLTDDSEADLAGAQHVLGDEAFVAAEWIAVTINAFNRISILSRHPVRPRDAEGKVVR